MAQTFTMDDLKQRLQARQHKMTPQRQTVLQVVLDHPVNQASIAPLLTGWGKKDERVHIGMGMGGNRVGSVCLDQKGQPFPLEIEAENWIVFKCKIFI